MNKYIKFLLLAIVAIAFSLPVSAAKDGKQLPLDPTRSEEAHV